MDQWIYQEDAPESRPNIHTSDGTIFIYNRVSGAYEPYKKSQENENTADKTERKKAGWFPVEIRRDWLVLGVTTGISVMTLVVVSVYTYYARQQARAAMKQLQLSSDAMRLDERAWVSVLNVKPITDGSVGAKIIFQNTGKTPATDFHVSAVADTDKSSIEKSMAGKGVIAPSGEFTSTVRPENKPPSKAGITYHGTAYYVSVFGHQHWTKFCYYRPDNATGFIPCDSGNEIDQSEP